MSLRFLLLGAVAATSIVALAGCPSTPGPGPSDAAVGTPCTDHADCDDGRFCNGPERCTPDAGSADERGCSPGAAPCAAAECDEGTDVCASGCVEPDADGDGADARACGGTDCDDADPNRAPGRAEVCDVADLDEDCDPRTFGVRDLDLDGEADALCCNEDDTGARACGRDCDDTRAAVGPTSPELCNGTDDDCDGAIDEGGTMTFYRDADGDGHGDAADFRDDLCGPMGEYDTTTGDDCDDADPLVFPSAREICNGEDDDCSSGGGAEPAEDVDGDGHTSSTYSGCEAIPSSMPRDDCDDGNTDFHPGAPFQHAPFCRVGTSCLDSLGQWVCGGRAPSGFACDAVLSVRDYTWDYDCSGTNDRDAPPEHPDCDINCTIGSGTCGACATVGKLTCVAAVPLAETFVVTQAASCGAPATYRTCGGTGAGGGTCSACTTTDVSLPQRCR